MFGSLKWINPLHYIVQMPIDIAWWSVTKLKDITLAAWRKLPKPKSFVGKCIVYPLYAYIVVPGSVPYALIKMAEFAGYGQEVDELLTILAGTFGSLGVLALDSFLKTLAGVLWFLFTAITRL